jgi:hypothetical protein
MTRELPDPAVEPTISVERAGVILDVCRATAYVAARDGTIPTIKIGRRLVVPTAKFLAKFEL